MAMKYKQYDIMVSLKVVEGSFNSTSDIMKYIEYRLNLRSRGSDSIQMSNICLLQEKNFQNELPLGDSLTHGG